MNNGHTISETFKIIEITRHETYDYWNIGVLWKDSDSSVTEAMTKKYQFRNCDNEGEIDVPCLWNVTCYIIYTNYLICC